MVSWRADPHGGGRMAGGWISLWFLSEENGLQPYEMPCFLISFTLKATKLRQGHFQWLACCNEPLDPGCLGLERFCWSSLVQLSPFTHEQTEVQSWALACPRSMRAVASMWGDSCLGFKERGPVATSPPPSCHCLLLGVLVFPWSQETGRKEHPLPWQPDSRLLSPLTGAPLTRAAAGSAAGPWWGVLGLVTLFDVRENWRSSRQLLT